MEKNERYFIVSYMAEGKYGSATVTTTNGRYINMKIFTESTKREGISKLAIMNIIEMSESDFKDYTSI